MLQQECQVEEVKEVARDTFVLRFESPSISSSVHPGQFVNVLTSEGCDPLLRRPFSIYRTEGNFCEIIFNVVGKGTEILRRKRNRDTINVLGPLGVPFGCDDSSYTTAVLVAGGLGVAPLPILTSMMKTLKKDIVTVLGARSAQYLVDDHLENCHIATDDGTKGLRGNTVDLLGSVLEGDRCENPKIFACGPTAMLKALSEFSMQKNIPCEVSLEGPMACGFGICQGCPVELIDGKPKYALMCKDGPVFDVRQIVI